MSNVIDLKSYLAGMSALCTANPYVVITTGDGNNNNQNRFQKSYDDRERAFNDELNPQILRMYELDLKLPEDWKLQIQIMDKSNLSKLNDNLIGQTIIDMENRRYGDLLMQCQKSCELENQRLISQIPIIQKDKYIGEKNNKEQKDLFNKNKLAKITYLKENKTMINKMSKKLKEIEQVIVPVEYRELNHPQKSQTQGILELWTEILTIDDARKTPVSKMKTINQQTYELRIVIWETKEIPLTDGDSVDIFIRCTFDPTGWSSDEITLETDTHMSSKDGTGQFNWRMKFTIKVPCEFPRLKFQVLDAGVVSDEAIGETTLNLASTVKKMQGEDKISVPKSYVEFTNPCNPDDAKGMMLFSMEILTKEDADQDPVGMGQSEPNKDPILVRPTAGRGLGDAMASVGFKIPKISFNPFGHLLYPMIAAGVFALIFLLTYMFKA